MNSLRSPLTTPLAPKLFVCRWVLTARSLACFATRTSAQSSPGASSAPLNPIKVFASLMIILKGVTLDLPDGSFANFVGIPMRLLFFHKADSSFYGALEIDSGGPVFGTVVYDYVKFDPITGVVTTIKSRVDYMDDTRLPVNQNSSVLYAFNFKSWSPTTYTLYTINILAGDITDSVDVVLNDKGFYYDVMAYHNGLNKIFAITGDTAANYLVSIDPATGLVQELLTFSRQLFWGPIDYSEVTISESLNLLSFFAQKESGSGRAVIITVDLINHTLVASPSLSEEVWGWVYSTECAGTTSTENIDSDSKLSIIPNPSNGNKITIQSNREAIDKIELINFAGQTRCYSYQEQSVYEINTENLPNGLYLVRAIVGNKHYVERVIITN